MYTKFKAGKYPLCACVHAPQTVEHYPHNCTNCETLRRIYWPSETTKDVKLYCSMQEL